MVIIIVGAKGGTLMSSHITDLSSLILQLYRLRPLKVAVHVLFLMLCSRSVDKLIYVMIYAWKFPILSMNVKKLVQLNCAVAV